MLCPDAFDLKPCQKSLTGVEKLHEPNRTLDQWFRKPGFWLLFSKPMTQAQVITSWVAIPFICCGAAFIAFLPKRWVPRPKVPPVIYGPNILEIPLPWKPAAMFCFALVGGVAFMFVLAHLEPQGVDPFTLPTSSVQRIVIKQAHHSSLVSSDVDLSHQEIQALCSALQTATPISPNHPGTVWRCKLAIFTDDGQSVTVDVINSGGPRNGVLVDWWSPNLRLNLGTHRCDKLADVIGSVVASHRDAEPSATSLKEDSATAVGNSDITKEAPSAR